MTANAKQELFNILDSIGNKLDITPTQHKLAEVRYKAVGEWLANGTYCLINKKICLKDGEIYPQGSMKLQTAVKPLGREEFDVDLVFYTPEITSYDIAPTELNRLIGNRLREHETYKKMMEPLKRGWRITYANEFHLDITPSITNHQELHNNSELVPDRKLQDWKPSNPKDYSEWFDIVSTKTPLFKKVSGLDSAFESRAHTVTELPKNSSSKPLLKRYIQILKRHRDVMFQKKDHKPISIIITTLATKSYAHCITTSTYDNELDLLADVIKFMPSFIEGNLYNYKVLNPTTAHENFAERWNEFSAKKRAFDEWHKEAQNFFEALNNKVGQNKIFESLEHGFGKGPVSKVYEDITANVSSSRASGLLSLGVSASARDTFPMKKNTFFGS